MYHIFVCRLSFSHGELLSESDPKEPKSARFVFILSELFHYNTDCQFQRSHLVSGHGARVWYLLGTKVLARRVSSRPMDAHFWKKYKENSPNLLYVYGKTCLLDGQFSMSG